MRRAIACCAACLVLAGCAAPLSGVTRLSEVELDPQSTSVEVTEPASEARLEAQGGLFARLLGPRTTAPDALAEDAPAEALAETDDPAPQATDSDQPTTQDADRPRGGLFSLFRRQGDGGDAAQLASVDPGAAAQGGVFARPSPPRTTAPDAPAEALAETDDPAPQATDSDQAATQDADRPRGGLFSLFRRQDDGGDAAQVASVDPRAAAVNRQGATDPDAPDARLVAPGTVLPYGEVARVCDMPTRDMGQEVARYPERRPQYRVHDSAPGSTGARAFYVSGFADGCARQVTAAMAMFASPDMHEQLRYGAPADSLPYSDTDKAYEQIKRRICGVGRNQPCGARIGQLERDTAFVTVYERFGSNARWATILLHDGQVVARDTKSGG